MKIVKLVWLAVLLPCAASASVPSAPRPSPAPRPAASTAPDAIPPLLKRPEPEVWRDTGIVLDERDPAPRHAVLTYREALHFGMRFLYGIDVWPLDPDDRRIGSRWTIGADEFELIVSGFQTDGHRTVTIARGGKRNVMEFKPVAGIPPLERPADLALEDLPAILAALERKEPKLPALVTPAPAPDFSALGPKDIWIAVRPLEKAPAQVSGPEIARAAIGLAWTAFLDHRIGPAAAPILAADADALAAIAVRRAGIPLPDAAEAAWLAPAAATGDCWLLARTPPPSKSADLKALHEAYVQATIDEQALPCTGGAVAMAERAIALDDPSECWRMVPKGFNGRFAKYYSAQVDDFSMLAKCASTPFSFVLEDLQEMVEKGLVLPAELASRLPGKTEWALGVFGAGPILHRAELTVSLGRELLSLGAKTRNWPARWMLQETGDRALHALCPIGGQYANYGWDKELTTLFAPVKAMSSWLHPEVQWLLTDNQVFNGERSRTAIANSLFALPSIPGLAHRTATADPAQRVTARFLWQVRMLQLSAWARSPAVAADVLIEAAAGGHPSIALALLRKLMRENPTCVAPLCGRILARLPAAMKREVLALAAKGNIRSPLVVHELAAALLAQGDPAGAAGIALPALTTDRATPEIALDVVSALCRQKKIAAAESEVERIRHNLPGITRSTVMLAFANECLEAGDLARAKTWGENGADTHAAWAYTGHAMIALALKDTATAKAEAAAASQHYGPSDDFTLIETIAAVIDSDGKTGWPALEAQLKNTAPHGWDPIAKVLDRSKTKIPPTPVGQQLTFALDVSRLDGDGAPDAKLVNTLLPRTYGKDEISRWCRARLAIDALPLVARSLICRPALDAKTIWALFWLVSSDTFACVHATLHVMAARGATDAQLMAALELCTPLLQPPERALATALTNPARLARWLQVTNAAASLDANIGEFLVSTWLTDDRADALALLGALLPGDPKLQPKPRKLLPLLTMLAGSDTEATAFALAHGIKEADLKAWGWDDNLRAVPRMMTQLAHLRPPGANPNLLK